MRHLISEWWMMGPVCIPEVYIGRPFCALPGIWSSTLAPRSAPVCWERTTGGSIKHSSCVKWRELLYFVCVSVITSILEIIGSVTLAPSQFFYRPWFDPVQTLAVISVARAEGTLCTFVDGWDEPLKEAEMKQSTRQVENEMDEQVLEAGEQCFKEECVRTWQIV